MQVFINVLIEVGRKYNLSAELVIVEWNPPNNNPRLKDALNWPKKVEPIKVRIIEVPNKLHQKLPNSDKTPFFLGIAKNVGIRRARGEYILITNPDIIYNEPLIRFLASKPLSKDSIYRIDRYDVDKIIPLKLNYDKKLRFCENNVFRVNFLNGNVIFNSSFISSLLYHFKKRYISLRSRFLMILNNQISKNLKKKHIITSKTNKNFKRNLLNRFKSLIQYFFSFLPQFIIKDISFLASPHIYIKNFADVFDVKWGIHTNAAGDFILMAREHWYNLKGYPELKTFSFLDGLCCHKALAYGLNQIVLKNPMRIYHQEHDRTGRGKRPRTDYQHYLEYGKKMVTTKKPIILNKEEWGFDDYHLPEYQIKT